MPAAVATRRKILCVSPAYSPSFGTFEYAYPLCGDIRAFMPPQGLLVIAAYLPSEWEVRFVDENMAPAKEADFAWADVVFTSGMHVQREQIISVCRRAHRLGKAAALGGPSVSADPDVYREFDYLHIGELGDGTDRLIAVLDAGVARPPEQMRFQTGERVPLSDFPVPAYHLADIGRYFIGSVQFSSGCPYRCEFCDIPALYGRNPRLKTPQQVTAELDAMLARANPSAVYFVDDNFVGNRKAARALVAELVRWQKSRNYPLQFACEATLNIVKDPELLTLMREAYFCTVFCGIETPETEALHAMKKDHNTTVPILEAVETLNGFGMEVVSGIILGLDTDSCETPSRIIEFVRRSRIPMLTVNLLQALPRTPLWDRLSAAGRLIDNPGRESNVDFRLPYDDVVGMWRRCMAEIYAPEELYRRFTWNVEHTYANRIAVPAAGRATAANIKRALRIFVNLTLRVGILADYRAIFWRMARPLLKQGRVEDVFHVGLVAHHLIKFARDAARGDENASFYSAKLSRRAAAAQAVRIPTVS